MFTVKKNWENSAVALHAQNCQGSIDFEKTKTVKVEYNRFNRKVCETLEILLNKYVDTKFWTPFFDYVWKKRRILNDDDRKTTVLTSVKNMQCFLFFHL